MVRVVVIQLNRMGRKIILERIKFAVRILNFRTFG